MVDEKTEKLIVLFDGVCNFCNASVNFIIDRNPKNNIYFASLQSEAGKHWLEKFKLPTSDFDTMVVIEGEHYYTRSTAGLKIVRHLKGLWPLLYGLIILPSFLRDIGYNLIAKNRYRWFGKTDTCRIPTPELKQRFL